jgi:YD repeat-containing protein
MVDLLGNTLIDNIDACQNVILPYTFSFADQSAQGGFPDCCGYLPGYLSTDLTNQLVPEEAYSGSLTLGGDASLCCSGGFHLLSLPDCLDLEVSRIWPTDCGFAFTHKSSMQFTAYLRRNSNSIPLASWSINKLSESPLPPVRGGFERLPADGKSTAQASSAPAAVGPLTYSFTGPSLGATLTGSGLLTAGTKRGTVQVTVTTTNSAVNADVCMQRDFYFDIGPDGPCCTGPDCEVQYQNSSVEILFNLGRSQKSDDPAFLEVTSELPSLALGTPELLRSDYIRPGLTKITNAAGWLRQVRAYEKVIDVITNSASSYSLKFYHPTNLLTLQTNGLYQFMGTPYQTFTIELVGGDTNHVRITEAADGAVTDYHWEGAGWALVTGGGLRRETKSVSVAGGIRTETVTIEGGDSVVVRETITKWQTNLAGIGEIIEEVIGSGSAARTNSYLYETNGQLRQVTRGDGSWDIYVYDSIGRQTEHYRPFLNSAPTTNSSLCRLTSTTYTNSVVSGSGDEHTVGPFTPRRVIEYILGTEVSRRYAVVKWGEHRDIRCPNPGAAWDDSGNMVTVSYTLTDSRYFGQPGKISHADGTIQLFRYFREQMPGVAYGDERQKTEIYTGAPNIGGSTVTQGTKEETWASPSLPDRIALRRLTDISSQLLTSQETYSYDFQGRLTNTTYLDGANISQAYNCCGVTSRTDRDGTVTTYIYDALQRDLTSTRDGITTSNVWDAAGNLLATYRIGTNGSVILVTAADFNTAGRLLATTNALDQVTLYAESIDASGVTTRTTTNPNTSTRIEATARDGTLLTMTGTSVLPVRYTNGVVSIGSVDRFYSQEIKLLTNGTDSAEWVKSVSDGLGRPMETQFPNNSTNRTAYNAQGQLASEVDPDGVVTLYSYDDLGQVAYRALDVDRNGSIDLGGIDRVTATVSDVVSNATFGATVRRSFAYVWNTTNDATSALISETVSSVDGRQSWSTFNGLTTYSRMDYLGNGATRMTQTSPDGTQSLQEISIRSRAFQHDQQCHTRHPATTDNRLRFAQPPVLRHRSSHGHDEFHLR